MDIVVLSEKNKLLQYVNELKTFTEEAKAGLSNYDAYDPMKYRSDACYALKESSLLLSRLSVRIEEIQCAMQKLLEKDSSALDNELLVLMNAANEAKLKAEILLAKLEAKLFYFDNAENVHQTSRPTSTLERELVLNAQLNENDEESVHQTVPFKSVADSAESRRNEFKLEKITKFNSDREFMLFWEEFHRTVDSAPILTKYKFAALLSLVRGEPSQLLLNLDYTRDEDYQEALQRLFNKYASEELKQTWMEHKHPAEQSHCECENYLEASQWLFGKHVSDELEQKWTMSASFKNAGKPPPSKWSDKYFNEKYCEAVPQYQAPNSKLLLKAIHAFLNLYILGPNHKLTKDVDYATIWLILLHGWRQESDCIISRPVKKMEFTPKQEVLYDAMAQRRIIRSQPVSYHFDNFDDFSLPKPDYKLDIGKPYFLNQNRYPEENPVSWVFNGAHKEEIVITQTKVGSWYSSWLKKVGPYDDHYKSCVVQERDVHYFSLLSFVLFGASMKRPENVEKFIAVSFDKIKTVCDTKRNASSKIQDTVPPHAAIYSFIRTKLFEQNGPNFKKYLTHVLDFYINEEHYISSNYELFRHMVDADLEYFARKNTGLIYWLQRAAEHLQKPPHELLKLLLVDPSLKTHVNKIQKFLKAYKKQTTWRWARLFENDIFEEITIQSCPAFAYACFVLDPLNKIEVRKNKQYPDEFLGFINSGDPPSLTGENLGTLLREIIAYPEDGEFWEVSEELDKAV